jgi:hypothetical protein
MDDPHHLAHAFNNILFVILARAELLLMSDLDENDARRVDALEIRDAAVRGATLTRELLARIVP